MAYNDKGHLKRLLLSRGWKPANETELNSIVDMYAKGDLGGESDYDAIQRAADRFTNISKAFYNSDQKAAYDPEGIASFVRYYKERGQDVNADELTKALEVTGKRDDPNQAFEVSKVVMKPGAADAIRAYGATDYIKKSEQERDRIGAITEGLKRNGETADKASIDDYSKQFTSKDGTLQSVAPEKMDRRIQLKKLGYDTSSMVDRDVDQTWDTKTAYETATKKPADKAAIDEYKKSASGSGNKDVNVNTQTQVIGATETVKETLNPGSGTPPSGATTTTSSGTSTTSDGMQTPGGGTTGKQGEAGTTIDDLSNLKMDNNNTILEGPFAGLKMYKDVAYDPATKRLYRQEAAPSAGVFTGTTPTLDIKNPDEILGAADNSLITESRRVLAEALSGHITPEEQAALDHQFDQYMGQIESQAAERGTPVGAVIGMKMRAAQELAFQGQAAAKQRQQAAVSGAVGLESFVTGRDTARQGVAVNQAQVVFNSSLQKYMTDYDTYLKNYQVQLQGAGFTQAIIEGALNKERQGMQDNVAEYTRQFQEKWGAYGAAMDFLKYNDQKDAYGAAVDKANEPKPFDWFGAAKDVGKIALTAINPAAGAVATVADKETTRPPGGSGLPSYGGNSWGNWAANGTSPTNLPGTSLVPNAPWWQMGGS